MSNFSSQRGVALYLALAILAILLAIAFGISAIVIGQLRTLKAVGYSVVALYAADTGIEKELYAKNYQTQPEGYTYAEFLNLDGDSQVGSGSCPAGLGDPDDACAQILIVSLEPLRIRSSGYYREVHRALEIEF